MSQSGLNSLQKTPQLASALTAKPSSSSSSSTKPKPKKSMDGEVIDLDESAD